MKFSKVIATDKSDVHKTRSGVKGHDHNGENKFYLNLGISGL